MEKDIKIKVLGIGGGGGNAVNRIIKAGLNGVEFVALNTDAIMLNKSQAENKVLLGQKRLDGLGAGGNAEKGKKAAEETEEDIVKAIGKADIVFIIAGMGGGTGTGAAPVVAKIAKETGALTIGIVTKPFDFEGKKRIGQAILGIDKLKDTVDSLIVIPNEKLLEMFGRKQTMKEAFGIVDEIILKTIRGISDVITKAGEIIIEFDFDEIKKVMESSGLAFVGFGEGTGKNRAKKAAEKAIKSPFLENSIKDATGIIMNITGGRDMDLIEATSAARVISDAIKDDVTFHFGVVIDEKMDYKIQVTVIATGINSEGATVQSKNFESVDGYIDSKKQIIENQIYKLKRDIYMLETENKVNLERQKMFAEEISHKETILQTQNKDLEDLQKKLYEIKTSIPDFDMEIYNKYKEYILMKSKIEQIAKSITDAKRRMCELIALKNELTAKDTELKRKILELETKLDKLENEEN